MTTTIAPSLGHGILDTQAGVGASPGYDAIDRRRFFTGFERGEGVATYGSFRVSQRGAGANMSVDVNMDDGAYVRGDAVALQALYYLPPHSATINEVIAASDPTNPRVDRVILEVKDNTHDAGGANVGQTRVVTGTPTGGATLDNLTGAAAVPSSALLLADVLVPAASSTVVDANIRDRRQFTTGIPPLLTKVDMADLVPHSSLVIPDGSGNVPATNFQHAVLCRLARRIAGATRIRWRYQQNAVTPATGNYMFAIYDATGRKIVDTGAVAFTGAADAIVSRAETITATTFEAGLYYVLCGSAITGTIQSVPVVRGRATTTSNFVTVAYPNVMLSSDTGGTTAPATLLGFADLGTSAGDGQSFREVPLVALSVG